MLPYLVAHIVQQCLWLRETIEELQWSDKTPITGDSLHIWLAMLHLMSIEPETVFEDTVAFKHLYVPSSYIIKQGQKLSFNGLLITTNNKVIRFDLFQVRNPDFKHVLLKIEIPKG